MDTVYAKHTPCFRGVDTIYSGGRYCVYYALRSIFGGWILFMLCTTQYFRGMDTIYTMYYDVVFLGGEYYLYYALRSIFGGRS